MSKDRARRRQARQREAAVVAASRAAQAERRERREARVRAVTARVPGLTGGRGRQTGTLAERKRRQTAFLVAALLAVNILVWVFVPGWSARAMALVVSVLVAPVLHTLLFRR